MKVPTVVGARPQFVKAAAVSRAMAQKSGLQEILLHTGQHFDPCLSAAFFEELGIPAPRHHLGIGGSTHGQNTGRMHDAIEGVLLKEKPDWVLVYGDTDSTLAGALAAVKLRVSVVPCRSRVALLQPTHARRDQPRTDGPRRRPAHYAHSHGHG